jgi:hypothetical protein
MIVVWAVSVGSLQQRERAAGGHLTEPSLYPTGGNQTSPCILRVIPVTPSQLHRQQARQNCEVACLWRCCEQGREVEGGQMGSSFLIWSRQARLVHPPPELELAQALISSALCTSP